MKKNEEEWRRMKNNGEELRGEKKEWSGKEKGGSVSYHKESLITHKNEMIQEFH